MIGQETALRKQYRDGKMLLDEYIHELLRLKPSIVCVDEVQELVLQELVREVDLDGCRCRIVVADRVAKKYARVLVQLADEMGSCTCGGC
jgi:hypothetical protein